MRPVTALVLVGVVAVFGGIVIFTFTGGGTPDGKLTERWISDTDRDNVRNHHAVSVGPDGDVIVAPVATIAANNTRLSPTSCSLNRLTPRNGSVQWNTTTPPEGCFMHALTQPAIADVDDDGSLEVVTATIQNATIIYDAETGAEESRIPLSTYGYARPAVGNVTGASGLDIVTVDIDGHVVVANGAGDVHWTKSLSGSVWAAPAVADVDADGQQEVVVGTSEQTVALNADGSIAWRVDVPSQDLDTGQADSTDAIEIFAASNDGVVTLNGKDGAVEWEQSIRGGATLSLDAVGDGDDDGTTEVYYSEPGNVVGALNAESGQEEWSTRLAPEENTMTPAPVIGDLTGDGTQELVTVTNAGTVTVLSPKSGSQLAVYQRNVPVWTFPTVADITEASSGAEILIQYGDGRATALTYTESD